MPKEEAQPLLANKHEFVESLDNMIQKAMNLQQAVDMALELGDLPDPVKKQLQQARDEFKAAIFT